MSLPRSRTTQKSCLAAMRKTSYLLKKKLFLRSRHRLRSTRSMGVPFADQSASIAELVPRPIFIALVILYASFDSFFLIFYSESGATCMACYNRLRAGPSSILLEDASRPKVLLDMLITNLKLLIFFEFDVIRSVLINFHLSSSTSLLAPILNQMMNLLKSYITRVMEAMFPPHINNLINIKINTGTKYTLTFLEPSLITSRRALRRLFVRWHRLCWSMVPFVCKMQSTFTRLLAAVHMRIPLAFLSIYFVICLYRHSLVRASWAGCYLSALIPSRSLRACCSTFAFLKIDSAHSMQCQRRRITSSSS